uniref:DUF4283 domain-containing protein n=1 Tax=Cannabis sativa TaxID=3483 RepID=A0A803Q7S4_CANSA
MRNLENSFRNSGDNNSKVRITFEDIEEEVSFWTPSIVCYVLGANPPLHVLEGFVNRIWKDKIDKVKLLAYGVFIIRFSSIEYRDQILNGGYIFFNRRPVIMKPWNPHENFKKENVKCVPIWIQLEELELKYWGHGTLSKIVSQVGKFVMLDSITRERERLSYARVMVEVMMDQKFPDFLEFENEFGSTTTVMLKYEWKPVACTHCSGFGHTAEECRKHSNGKPQWVMKKDNRKQVETDAEGFVKVTRNKSKAEYNESEVAGKKGASTMIYAANNRVERRVLWKDLNDLNTSENWLLMGDFNDILAKEEMIGFRVKSYPDSDFLQCVNSCGLEDVKSSGNFFIWSNKQSGEDRIYSKIDRILANQTWINRYEYAEAVFLNEGIFDHSPGILTLYLGIVRGKKPFKYFRMWKSHPKYELALNEIWKSEIRGSKMYQVVSKMKQLKVKLKEINREGFSDLHSALIVVKQIWINGKIYFRSNI